MAQLAWEQAVGKEYRSRLDEFAVGRKAEEGVETMVGLAERKMMVKGRVLWVAKDDEFSEASRRRYTS